MPLRWFRRTSRGIADDLWAQVLQSQPLVGHLGAADLTRLRALVDGFLAEKHISGAAGFAPDALVQASIALQACLPALNLGLRAYADFVEVIVYPDQFLVPRRRTDDAGVVHEGIEALAGEAMDGGPVVLSWADIGPGSHETGGNVTIHEFVHKIDLLDGEADGIPPLPAGRHARWVRLLEDTYDAFCDALEHVEAQIPRSVDPESAAADRYYEALPLDPYAATDPSEFFAVSGEAFFVTPVRLKSAYPEWYQALSEFFGQDPAGAHDAEASSIR